MLSQKRRHKTKRYIVRHLSDMRGLHEVYICVTSRTDFRRFRGCVWAFHQRGLSLGSLGWFVTLICGANSDVRMAWKRLVDAFLAMFYRVMILALTSGGASLKTKIQRC
jgi:hypothetical protein